MSVDAAAGRPLQGGCLCGGVRYRIAGRDALRPVVACHCEQCRKTSGHYVAATRVPAGAVEIVADETLTWFRSSPHAERGFCGRCGGNVLWRQIAGDDISIMAGTLEAPTGLTLAMHIFTAFKGDYYEIADDVHVFEGPDG